MLREQRIALLVLIIVVGFSVAVVYHYVMGHYFGKPWPANTFLHTPGARFLDLKLVVRQSAALDPFGEDIGGFAGSPFGQLVGYLFSLVHPTSLQLVIFFGSFFVPFVLMVKHYLYGLKSRLTSYQLLAVFAIVFLTYPVLFGADRANLDLLVLPCLFLFALTYQQRNYRASTVFLALAIALKPYTAPLIMVYVFDRRFKDGLLVFLNTAFLTVLSLSLFRDGLFVETEKYFATLSHTVDYLSVGSQQVFTSDLYSLLTIVIEFVGHTFNIDSSGTTMYLPAHPLARTAYVILAVIVSIYFLIYLWKKPRPLWQAMAVLTILIVLLPMNSHDYRLIYLFVPMLMYLASNEEKRNDLLIVILWGLLLVPKNYCALQHPPQNIGMIINPLLLIGLIVCIIPGAFSISGMHSTLRFVYGKSRSVFSTCYMKVMSIAKVQRSDPPAKSGGQSDHDRFEHDFLAACVIVLISITILAAIDLAISHFVRNELDQSVVDRVILPLSEFKPEQIERTQYLISLIGFPILCFAGWLLSNRFCSRIERVRPVVYPVVASSVAVGVGLWSYFALERIDFSYIEGFSFLTVIFCLSILLIIYVERKYSPKWLALLLDIGAIGLCLFLSLAIVFYCISTENDPQSYSWHLNAYGYSIVQVFGGKTLLVDLTNQYGFYPYFLEPVFRIVGLHIVQLTTVLGLLLAGVFAILFFLIKQLVRSRAIALCAFLAMPGAWLWAQSFTEYGPVFQHWPHRVLFPVLLLLIVWFYQKGVGRSKVLLYYLAFIVCGMAVLWNLNTGIVVLASWILFLSWETLGQSRSLRFKKTAAAIMQHSCIALTVAILSIGCLYIYTYLRSGVFPDMLAAIRYEGIFYGSGFSMIPMPLIHPWNLVVLTYCVGICISFSWLAKKMSRVNLAADQLQKSRVNMMFIVSIMGAGLFSYYQGRSADASLLDSFWSAFFLMGLFADGLLEHLSANFNRSSPITRRASNIATGSLFLLLSVVLVCYAGGVAELSPKFSDRIKTEIQAVDQWRNGESSSYAQNIDFIREYYSPGDQVLILGWNQATYYMESGTTNPLDIPGFLELVYKSDYQRLSDYLTNGTVVNEEGRLVPVRVIMLDEFEGLYPDLFQLVNSHYHQIDRVNDLTLLERNLTAQ